MNGPVQYWVRATARRRAGSLAVLALLIALGAGGAMGAAAGARRTETAVGRLAAESNMADAFVLAIDSRTFDRLTSGPEVEAATANTQLGLQPSTVDCTDSGDAYFPVMVTSGGEPFSIARPRVLDGRLPDPDAANEAAVSEQHAKRLAVGVGDRIRFVPYILDPESGEPVGCGDDVVAEVEVVGVIREIEEIGANGEPTRSHTYLTAAFMDAHPEAAGLELFGIGGYVRLAPGVDVGTFVDDLRAEAPLNEHGEPVGVAYRLDGPSPVDPAMKALSVGLWGLAGVLALATAISIAVAIARQTAAGDAERRILAALGFDRRRLVAAAALGGAGAAGLGAAGAVVVAAGLSTVHLVGVADVVEPDPGFEIDATVLAVGCAVLLTSVVGVTALTAWRAAKRAGVAPSASPPHRPGLVDRLLHVGVPPWAALGSGYALGGRRAAGPAVPGRAALAGVVTGTAGLLGVLLFGVGVGRASDDPSVYGWGDWDARISQDNPTQEADPLAVALADPDVATVAAINLRFVLTLDGEIVAGTPIANLRGRSGPTVVRGRLPVGTQEIGLGVDTAADLHVGLGDTVRIEGPSGDGDLRVVALLAFPGVDSEAISQGWSLDREALDAVGYEPGCNDRDCFQGIAISWREGGDVDAAIARFREANLSVDVPEPGPEVVLISQADQIPGVAAVGVGLIAVLGLAHTLATTVRRRRRELSVARALGFGRRQASGVLLAEALALGVVGAGLGGLMGVLIGGQAWRAAAQAIGIGPALPGTGILIVAVALGVVALCLVVAIVPAVQAARLSPAVGLRDER